MSRLKQMAAVSNMTVCPDRIVTASVAEGTTPPQVAGLDQAPFAPGVVLGRMLAEPLEFGVELSPPPPPPPPQADRAVPKAIEALDAEVHLRKLFLEIFICL